MGVESTALSVLPPLGHAYVYMTHPVGKIALNSVDANYFATMKIPRVRGRTFRPGDSETNIIIRDRLARRLWPNEDPLGKEFADPDQKLPTSAAGLASFGVPKRQSSWTVIGVAGNAPILEISDSDALELYKPLTTAGFHNATVIVRTSNLDPVLGTARKAGGRLRPGSGGASRSDPRPDTRAAWIRGGRRRFQFPRSVAWRCSSRLSDWPDWCRTRSRSERRRSASVWRSAPARVKPYGSVLLNW